ncbi:MAG: hypothetical protein OXS29_12775, partial [bacterium]|nr:hypothetical protein [bacterium]MDE0290871.1 hypothetical protein [bacterium]MDE0439181.1 hypothetical protein [bacterium]
MVGTVYAPRRPPFPVSSWQQVHVPEDLMSLGDLSGCATVKVRLDENAAETIFQGLVRRGATTCPQWKEAFRESDGLTVEFTHMVTTGRSLRGVIGEQVQGRIVD